MDELDIASFAAALVESEVATGKPVQFAAPVTPNAPDVSEVDVSDDFTHQVLTEGLWSKAKVDVGFVPKKKKPAPTYKEPSLVENEEPSSRPLIEEAVYKNHLLREYKKKVEDLQGLVGLMESMGMVGGAGMNASVGTTVGRIGVAPMGKAPTKKKKRKNVKSSRLYR